MKNPDKPSKLAAISTAALLALASSCESSDDLRIHAIIDHTLESVGECLVVDKECDPWSKDNSRRCKMVDNEKFCESFLKIGEHDDYYTFIYDRSGRFGVGIYVRECGDECDRRCRSKSDYGCRNKFGVIRDLYDLDFDSRKYHREGDRYTEDTLGCSEKVSGEGYLCEEFKGGIDSKFGETEISQATGDLLVAYLKEKLRNFRKKIKVPKFLKRGKD